MTKDEYIERATAAYADRLCRCLEAGHFRHTAQESQAAVDAVMAELGMAIEGALEHSARVQERIRENRCLVCAMWFDDFAEVNVCGFCRDAILKGEVSDEIWEIAHPKEPVAATC